MESKTIPNDEKHIELLKANLNAPFSINIFLKLL